MKIFWDFSFIICAKIQCFLRRKEKTGIIPNLLADITKYKEAECCGKWQDFVIFDIKNDISCKVRQDFASSHFQYKKEKSGMIPNLLADITKYKGAECCGKWKDFVIFDIKNDISCKVRQDFASSHFQYKKEKTGMIPNLFGGYYKIQGSRMLRQVTGFCHFNHENIVAVTAEM